MFRMLIGPESGIGLPSSPVTVTVTASAADGAIMATATTVIASSPLRPLR
jgi:hypothetical protein